MSIYDAQERYDRWWRGKKCRTAHSTGPFKRVVRIRLAGPPSFVYGVAILVFADGTESNIPTPSFKPRKCDVEVMKA